MVVNQTSHQVFLVDFAQCFSRDTVFDPWYEDTEDWDADAEFCKVIRMRDNPVAIALPMVRRLREKFGWKLDIVYLNRMICSRRATVRRRTSKNAI